MIEDAARVNVAAELERAAGRAERAGGLAAAALPRARDRPHPRSLAPCAARPGRGADEVRGGGSLDDARGLLATAEAGALGDIDRAREHLLRAQIAFASRRGSDAPPLLLKAARRLEALDARLARATYLEALSAARFAGPLGDGARVVEVSAAALACPRAEPPRPPDLLLRGFATLFTEGYRAGAPILKEALGAFRREAVLPPHEARWRALACRAAADVWDDETWRLLATWELERLRRAGALTALPLALSTLGYIQAISGDLAAAESLLDEIRATTEATAIPAHRYVALWIAGLRGREAELTALVDATRRDAVPRGEGFALAITEQTRAVLYNGLGRYDAAVDAVRGAVDVALYSEMGSPRAVVELIEAAVRTGEHRLAERALERLAETTRPGATEWALGMEARSRALLSDGDAADQLYREAIDRLARTRLRVQLARARLLYGEWLRRERRRLDAREQLRTALELFTTMGTEAFADRAERELLATGERVRKRSIETSDALTAQEAQIARLAGDGLSNAEIGARLFISRHTVAYHLRKVFSKLEVTSRNQLMRVMASRLEAEPVRG